MYSCDDHYILYMKNYFFLHVSSRWPLLKWKIYVQRIKLELVCVCEFYSLFASVDRIDHFQYVKIQLNGKA